MKPKLSKSKRLPLEPFRGLNASYRAIAILGEGAYGITYRAVTEDNSKQQVVIKCPKLDTSRPFFDIVSRLAKTYETFNLEFIGMKRLRGLSCIAQVIDFGNYQFTVKGESFLALFIVQELIEGNRLDEFLMKNFSDPIERKFRGIQDVAEYSKWARKITSCLAEVHKREVVHGDLWYKNIMVRSAREPVLIDFGQSLFLDLAFDARGGEHYTHKFCAPERRDSKRKWHVGADIYSLGGTLFYLATGEDPPDTIKDIEELKATVATLIKTANPMLYSVNSGVADVVARCLRYSDRDRTRHIEDVLQDLETFFPSSDFTMITPSKAARSLAGAAKRLERKKDPLFSFMASLRIRLVHHEVEKMTHGLHELMGDHEQIARGLTQFLSLLDKGDEYLAVTIPSFWYPHNLGINGRFLTMNRHVAQRGVIVRRVFLITNRDEYRDKYLKKIIEAHTRIIGELRDIGIDTDKRCLNGNSGYYTGVKRLDTQERDRLLNAGNHFGLWRKDGQEVMIVPVYREKDGVIVGVRFWASPQDRVRQLKPYLSELLEESIPFLEYQFPQRKR